MYGQVIKHWKKIAVGTALAAAFGGAALDNALKRDVTVTLENAQQVEWVKPTTDAEWSEDVKKENLDIHSTATLKSMLATHETKLQKELENNKPIACPECIQYELRQGLRKGYGLTGKALDDETASAVKTEIDTYTYDVEKLTQSIERMQNELRLREKGFVGVEDADQPNLDAKIEPYEIRHPRD